MTLKQLKDGDDHLPDLLRQMKKIIETSRIDVARNVNSREYIVTFHHEEDKHATETARIKLQREGKTRFSLSDSANELMTVHMS